MAKLRIDYPLVYTRAPAFRGIFDLFEPPCPAPGPRLVAVLQTSMRRIKRAIVTTVSLCKRGKNNLVTMFKAKAEDGPEELVLNTLVRKSEEDGTLLAVVYAPELPDEDGHVADREVIRESAHAFLRDHRQLDIEHDGKILPHDSAYVAESFIIAEGDKRFEDWKDYEGNPVDVTGGWALEIKIEDPELRAAYRDGDWDGVSMFGLAATEPMQPKAASKKVLDRMRGRGDSSQGEPEVDEEKFEQMLKSMASTIVDGVTKAITKNDGKDGDPDPEPQVDPIEKAISELERPALPADVTDPEAMAEFAKASRRYELAVKSIKGELTADEIETMAKSLTAKAPSDDECGIDADDTPEERRLKRELFELRKSRSEPEPDADDTATERVAKSKRRSSLAGAISGSFNGGGSSTSFRKVKKD